MVRRTTASEDGRETTTVEDILSSTSLVTPSNDIYHDLDPEGAIQTNGIDVNHGSAMEALSIEQRYQLERQTAKVRHWRESQYAVGMVEVTWKDELSRHLNDDDDDVNGANRECCSDAASDSMDPTCGCLIASGYVCSKIGAGRIGNMAVLKERVVTEKDENGTAVSRTKIEFIVGPYWPMMMFITYPLIFGVSFWTAYTAIPNVPVAISSVWAILTFGLCLSLFNVAFRDPGILPRFDKVPTDEQQKKLGYESKFQNGRSSSRQEWKWNDTALTYRPRSAHFDPDCAVIVEEFDHT